MPHLSCVVLVCLVSAVNVSCLSWPVTAGVEGMVPFGEARRVISPGRLGKQVLRSAEALRLALPPSRPNSLFRGHLRVEQPRATVRGPAGVRPQGQSG